MKIPFDIKYRPQIESGEYKVETRDGRSVRIICWDRVAKENTDDDLNICVLVPEDNGEAVYYYHQSGKKWVPDERFDLFIITPEPELTDYEQSVRVCVVDNLTTHIKDGNGSEMSSTVFIGDETAKKMASELLELARKELIEEQYTSDPRKTDLYKLGKEEALKDLPRWRKIGRGHNYSSNTEFIINGRYLEMTDHLNDVFKVALSELEKLPKEG